MIILISNICAVDYQLDNSFNHLIMFESDAGSDYGHSESKPIHQQLCQLKTKISQRQHQLSSQHQLIKVGNLKKIWQKSMDNKQKQANSTHNQDLNLFHNQKVNFFQTVWHREFDPTKIWKQVSDEIYQKLLQHNQTLKNQQSPHIDATSSTQQLPIKQTHYKNLSPQPTPSLKIELLKSNQFVSQPTQEISIETSTNKNRNHNISKTESAQMSISRKLEFKLLQSVTLNNQPHKGVLSISHQQQFQQHLKSHEFSTQTSYNCANVNSQCQVNMDSREKQKNFDSHPISQEVQTQIISNADCQCQTQSATIHSEHALEMMKQNMKKREQRLKGRIRYLEDVYTTLIEQQQNQFRELESAKTLNQQQKDLICQLEQQVEKMGQYCSTLLFSILQLTKQSTNIVLQPQQIFISNQSQGHLEQIEQNYQLMIETLTQENHIAEDIFKQQRDHLMNMIKALQAEQQKSTPKQASQTLQLMQTAKIYNFLISTKDLKINQLSQHFQNQRTQYQRQIESLQENNQNLKEELQKLKTVNIRQNSCQEQQKIKTQLKQCQQQISRLQECNQNCLESYKQANLKIEQLQRQNSQLLAAITQSNNKLSNQENQIEKQKAELFSKNSHLVKQLQICKKQHSYLKQKAKELQDKLIVESYVRHERQEEKNKFYDRTIQLQNEIKKTKQEAKVMRDQIAQSQGEVDLVSPHPNLSSQNQSQSAGKPFQQNSFNFQKARSEQIKTDSQPQKAKPVLRKVKSESNEDAEHTPSPFSPGAIDWENKFITIQQLSQQNRQTVKVSEADQIKSNKVPQNSYEPVSLKNYASGHEGSESQRKEEKVQSIDKDQSQKNSKLKLQKVVSIEYERSGDFIERKQEFNIGEDGQSKDGRVQQNSERPLNKTVPQVLTPIKSSVDFQTNFINESNSINHIDRNAANLSEMIRKLEKENKRIQIQKKQLQENLMRISNKWKKLKDQENEDEEKLVQASELREGIKIIIKNKEKMFKQFDHNDFETVCQQMERLIKETNRWVQMLTALTHQSKKRELLNDEKGIRKKNQKTNLNKDISREKSVYSAGNRRKKKFIDLDISPFDGQFHENQEQQINTLQRLFHEDKEMSEISSVKFHSENSSFFNSKSQIANIFDKETNPFKKDIVDEIINNQLNKQRAQAKYVQSIQQTQNSKNLNKELKSPKLILPSNGLTKNYQEKSVKSKKKMVNKTLEKMSLVQKKLDNNKKQYEEIVRKIIMSYEKKIKKMEKQFASFFKNLVANPQVVHSPQQTPITSEFTNSQHVKRLAKEKDEILQKNEELEKLVEHEQKESEKKQKALANKQELIVSLQKKLKEETEKRQKFSANYEHERVVSAKLNNLVVKYQEDFGNFMEKLVESDVNSQRHPCIQSKKDEKSEIQSQIQVKKSAQVQVQTDQTDYYNKAVMEINMQPKQKIEQQTQSLKQIEGMVYDLIDQTFQSQHSKQHMNRNSEGKVPMSISRRRSFSEASQSELKNFYKEIKKQIKKIAQQFEDIKFVEEGSSSYGNKLNHYLQQIKINIRKQRKQNGQKIMEIKRRTFDIINALIDHYKISEKTMQKILTSKQSEPQSFKYIQLRKNLKSFYAENRQQKIAYESYEEKLQKLEKELNNKRNQLEERNHQLNQLKESQSHLLDLKRNLSQESFNNSKQDEVFYEFEEKSEFNNLKSILEEMKELKKDLEFYKEKCQSYERQKKKKSQVLYMRR